jgi:hypothetical protein
MKLHQFFCVTLIFMNGFACAMDEEQKKPVKKFWEMTHEEQQEYRNNRTKAQVSYAQKLGKFHPKNEANWAKLCVAAARNNPVVSFEAESWQQKGVAFAIANGCDNRIIAALIDAGFDFSNAVDGEGGYNSPLQIAFKKWRDTWLGWNRGNRSLLTMQLLLERGASLSPKNGWNTLSLFLARPPINHGFGDKYDQESIEQWVFGIKHLLALGIDPGERPERYRWAGLGEDAPYMELVAGHNGTRPRYGDERDSVFCLSPSRYGYPALVSILRAHVPEKRVRQLLQKQLAWNRILNSAQIGCSHLKKKLHDMVFRKIFEHTIDNWTQNGQMRLCNADGGIFNWLESRWDERQLSSLEQYVCPPEGLRRLVEADLKRQLTFWAKKRRKIDLETDAAIPCDHCMNEEETSAPSDRDSSSELGYQAGCSLQ